MDRRWFRAVAVGALLALMFGLAVDSLRRESVTCDEPLHLTAGYAFWAFGDYRLQESHGALPQRWFALPLLMEGVKFPPRDGASWRHPGNLGLQPCGEFFFKCGNDPDAMVLQGRLMAMVPALLVTLAVYLWASRLFGGRAGLLACLLCASSPTMLAHGRLMTSDMTAALFFVLSAGTFWSLLRRLTWFRLAASSVCLGLLLVSKMSGGLGILVALLLFFFRLALRRPWPVRLRGLGSGRLHSWPRKLALGGAVALIHGLVGLAVIWSCYGWRFQPAKNWDNARDSYTEPHESVFSSLGSRQALFESLERWRVLPEAYIYGLAHTVEHAAERPSFLNGDYSLTGWWYYFPYCFLVKSSLALLAFICLGISGIAYRVVRRRSRRPVVLLGWLDRTSLIWTLLLVYGAAALSTNLNIGHRHLLPLYPPLLMLAGASTGWLLTRGRRWLIASMGAILLWHGISSARVHPHYLAYFNELAGGPEHGYQHLTDSNLDWGQDLPSLAHWLAEHNVKRGGDVLYLFYFGFDDPQRWGIQADRPRATSYLRFSKGGPVTCRAGTYCLSATSLVMPAMGPWNADRERKYVQALSEFRQMAQTHPFRRDDADTIALWRGAVTPVAECQFHRLRAHLMTRKPDALMGYSILVFRLSDAEIDAAVLP